MKSAARDGIRQSDSWQGVVRGEGNGIREKGKMINAEEALEKIIGQLDDMMGSAEQFSESTNQ